MIARGEAIIQKPAEKYIHIKSTREHFIGQAGWLACLVLIIMLAISALVPGINAFRQALGVQKILRAEVGLPRDELSNPFICLRSGADTVLTRSAIRQLSDDYLQGIALCLLVIDPQG